MAIQGDGQGQKSIKEKSHEESVSVNVRDDGPGGESKKGSHIEISGRTSPNKG